MIIPVNGVDKALGAHMQKIHKTSAVSGIERSRQADAVCISRFSALVEDARAKAISLPDVRTDLVEKARFSIQEGNRPQVTDIASAMINRAAKGQV
ncbi:MAG: hypothetical protein NT018_12985 [Armatimonadetes bacterium]|nr:hypothetical protein [Armatimonadota bacterium]